MTFADSLPSGIRADAAARRARALGTAAALLLALGLAPSASAAASGTCDPARPHPQGFSEHRLHSGGTERRYALYVPRSYSGQQRTPLVLDLHASGISPTTELEVTRMDRAAEERGFVVVLPVATTEFAGGGYTWDVPPADGGVDDIAFVEDVLAAVSQSLCVDETRIYATGFSGGARLASELACRRPERFAAISAVGGLRHPAGKEETCRGAGLPILAIHSVDDPINPYEHDPEQSQPYWTHGIDDALRSWAETMRCGTPTVEQLSQSVERVVHPDCRTRAELVLYRLRGSGHVWPGSDFAFPEYLGRPETSIDATELTIEFFYRFPPAQE